MNRRKFTQLAAAFPAWLVFQPSKIVQAESTQPAATQADVALFTHEDGPHLSSYIEALAKTPEVGSVNLCDPKGSTGFLGHVMRAALGKEAPVLIPEENLYLLQTIAAAYKAAETGHTQPVALS